MVGATDQTSIRRNFEDELAAELKAIGLAAFPSYQYIPENGKVAEARLKEAVRKANADAVIITRLLRVEQRADVSPGYYNPYPVFGLYGWYSSAWYGGFYPPPRVYRYPVYFTETTLHDVANDEVVWTGTIRTIPRMSMKRSKLMCRRGSRAQGAKYSMRINLRRRRNNRPN